MERSDKKEEEDQVDNDGFLRFPGHETRRPQAGAPKTSQPTELGIDLNEEALTELAKEKGISKEKLRSLLSASTAFMAPSTSSAPPAVILRPRPRSSTPVQLPAAASSSSSSAMAMAPTQQRMVILAEEPNEESSENPKAAAAEEPALETQLQEVNQDAEPLVPVEKEKKKRRIRIKKSYPKIACGVKRKATPASSSRVVLAREQRFERLRRLQRDRQERMDKIMKDDETEAEDEEPKEKKPRRRRTLQPTEEERLPTQKESLQDLHLQEPLRLQRQMLQASRKKLCANKKKLVYEAAGLSYMTNGRRRSWIRRKRWRRRKRMKNIWSAKSKNPR